MVFLGIFIFMFWWTNECQDASGLTNFLFSLFLFFLFCGGWTGGEGAVGMESGSSASLVSHSAKYEALSLRASGGKAPTRSHKSAAVVMQQQQQPIVESPHYLPQQETYHHTGPTASPAPHYYNYFEEDSAESGASSHASLPWAPGLPQHKFRSPFVAATMWVRFNHGFLQG